MEKVYQKLVRDHIPEIIRQDGGTPVCRTLGEDELLSALRQKLSEEVQEYLLSGETEELADILEVVMALARTQGAPWEEVERILKEKRAARGGFEQGVFLERVVKP